MDGVKSSDTISVTDDGKAMRHYPGALALAVLLLVSFGIGSVVVDIFAIISISQPVSVGAAYSDLKVQLLLSIVKVHGVVIMLVLLFMYLFRLIFGSFPFITSGNRSSPRSGLAEVAIDGEIQSKDPRAMLAAFIANTAFISREILARSGVFLYVGVLIASVGVVFFAWRSFGVADPPHGKDVGELLGYIVPLLPSAGVLFFIELVAFFFLRQYRVTMDEFRYFDAIRRNREESLVILRMFSENSTVTPTSEVLKAMAIYSAAGRLGKEETTELLELRKLQHDEAVVFERIAESIRDWRSEKGNKATKTN